MRVILLFALIVIAGTALAQDTNKNQRAQKAARDLFRNTSGPDMLEQEYKDSAEKMALQLEMNGQKNLKREITAIEKQSLRLFCIGKMKELMSYSTLEALSVPIILKHLTIEEIDQANKFFASETGRKMTALYGVMRQESEKAGRVAADKMTTPEWVDKFLTEFNQKFPGWIIKE